MIFSSIKLGSNLLLMAAELQVKQEDLLYPKNKKEILQFA